MKIVSTRIWPITMALSEPYTIAYEDVSTVTNIILCVNTDAGITGVGCAAPGPLVTGETAETVLDHCRRVVEPLLHGADPLRRASVRSQLKDALPGAPATLAMVDMALMDLLGKRAGLPVYEILGGYRNRFITSVTIGIMPELDTVRRARDLVSQGFRALKIKGGRDIDEDIHRVSKVREAVGLGIEIRFDANEGYDEAAALRFAAAADKLGVSVIEQPTSRLASEPLARIAQLSQVPIMADESFLDMRDAIALARDNAADMINIKLMKVGGITPAVHLMGLAAALGMGVMVGCMDEAAVSISAGLHVALSHPIVRFADLDGHLDLIGDPSAAALTLSDGYLYPSRLPGFGWTP